MLFRKSTGRTQATATYRPRWYTETAAFARERDYFLENLGLLISSGMGIAATLVTLRQTAKNQRMRRTIAAIEVMVNAGLPLWKAMQMTKVLPERSIALIRSGEEAGRMIEYLDLANSQRQQEKMFQARLRSALLYPGIVLGLAFVVAIGSVWLLLPKILLMFSDTSRLPAATRLLMAVASFFQAYGIYAVPAILAALGLAAYLLFFNHRTKSWGDAILFRLPGVNDLLRGVELARFGYVLGALLRAGFPIVDALESVRKGTPYRCYERLYAHLQEGVVRGQTFRDAMRSFPSIDDYVPIPFQQLIMSAESSGRLADTFAHMGVIFGEKTKELSRNLASLLEPVVLIVVGVVVGFVVLAIMGPIYGVSEQIGY